MLRLIKFTLKAIVLMKLMALAFSAGMGVAYVLQLRSQYQSWGVVDDMALPGDDLVGEADFVETRAIEIEATPAEVWPWLKQLGYGRGGWYSYPALDRAWSPAGGASNGSAVDGAAAAEDLAEGDVVPTQPGGGFVVREVEAASKLVLYIDDSMAREQLEEMAADASEEAVEAVTEMEMPPYAVSWAFALEDAADGRTRLIERLRARIEVPNDASRRAFPVLGLGVFALMRSQLQGIKRRVESMDEKAA